MSKSVPRLRVPVYEEQMQRLMAAAMKGHLVHGPELEELAERLSRLLGLKHVTLTANGFGALFAAVSASCRPGESVMTVPASTCFAMVNAIKAARAMPTFGELDEETLSISTASLLDAPEGLAAVIPDHFGSLASPCRAPRKFNGTLIEDAAQSFFSRMRSAPVADALVLSFYPTKLVNGIDGGAVLTNDEELHRKVQRVTSYAAQMRPEKDARYNLRLNNVNAAFALGTLDVEECIVSGARAIYARLAEVAELCGLRPQKMADDEVPSRFIVTCESLAQRDAIVASCRQDGVEAAAELLAVCEDNIAARFPVMRRMVERTFSLPCFPGMRDDETERVLAAIRRSC
jgi:perosamine synthetase